MKKLNKIFVVPNNDAEAIQIQKILLDKKQNFLVTQQQWGASWEGLEDKIKEKLQNFKGQIYGVELQGNNIYDGLNVDHHKYNDDDRSNKLSSIQQVAELVSYEMTDFDNFISVNDNGYIPAMEKLSNELDMTEEETKNIINQIRFLDRQAQGITKEQEEQSNQAILKLNLTEKQNLVIVHLPHSKCSTITDRLYGLYDNLLILSEDGESNFYGVGSVVSQLHKEFEGWCGGNLPEYGFWGGYADQTKIKKLVIKLLS